MSVTKAITLRLDPGDYERLESEAKRVGIAPATLARMLVRTGLSSEIESEAAKNRRMGLAALRGMATLRDCLPDTQPAVDVVEIIAAGRRERERALGV
jgi:hypothetical protein